MKIKTSSISPNCSFEFKKIETEHISALALLMHKAYQGTIDHEGETIEQCKEEMKNTLSGKYGEFMSFASFLIFENEQILSASMITKYKGRPLLAFSMTAPEAQGRGMARFLIGRSIEALHAHEYPDFYLVVTDGNHSAQKLYRSMGFEQLPA